MEKRLGIKRQERPKSYHGYVGKNGVRRSVAVDLLADELGQCGLVLADVLDYFLVYPRLYPLVD